MPGDGRPAPTRCSARRSRSVRTPTTQLTESTVAGYSQVELGLRVRAAAKPGQTVNLDPLDISVCTFTNDDVPMPALVVTKSAVPVSTTVVNEGQVITYTLTFANTAGQAPATVNHTDDLSAVLDDATVTTQPALATGAGLTVGPISG